MDESAKHPTALNARERAPNSKYLVQDILSDYLTIAKKEDDAAEAKAKAPSKNRNGSLDLKNLPSVSPPRWITRINGQTVDVRVDKERVQELVEKWLATFHQGMENERVRRKPSSSAAAAAAGGATTVATGSASMPARRALIHDLLSGNAATAGPNTGGLPCLHQLPLPHKPPRNFSFDTPW